ncbi:hypothetical protein [Terrabacter sp. 2RAF25]|uniref:hypothetical protein n=1 Tax=Terrabacter sp. 2RAF25 TaxID=3232998 RepID=UPI003F970E20
MTWPTLVQGRLLGTLLLIGGVVCAAPATLWPTDTLTLTPTPDEVAQGAQAQRIAFWSWGRVADASPGATDPTIDFGNPWGLLLLGVALLAGVVAAASHALRRGSAGLLLGVAGASWLAASVTAGIGQTAGRMQGYFFGLTEGLTADRTVAGVLQLVGTALLLAALGWMMRRAVASLATAAWSRGSALAEASRRRSPTAGPGTGAETATPRVGIATIRDVEPGAHPGWGGRAVGSIPGTGSRTDARSTVGFSEDENRDRSCESPTDPKRFRPSR